MFKKIIRSTLFLSGVETKRVVLLARPRIMTELSRGRAQRLRIAHRCGEVIEERHRSVRPQIFEFGSIGSDRSAQKIAHARLRGSHREHVVGRSGERAMQDRVLRGDVAKDAGLSDELQTNRLAVGVQMDVLASAQREGAETLRVSSTAASKMKDRHHSKDRRVRI